VSALSKTKLVTVICWAVSAVALLGLVLWFLLSGVFNIGFGWDLGLGTFEPVGTHRVAADNIDTLDVDWTSGAVTIGTHHGDEIVITELAQRSLRDDEALWLSTDGGTLTIRFMERSVIRVGNVLTKQLEILIPYALSQDFERFGVNTTSGRIVINHIQSTTFSASTTSGRIELRDITAQSLNANTTSGRIEVLGAEAEDISLRTTSGRIELRRMTAQTITATATSGRIEIFGAEAEDIFLHTTSGRIEARDTEAQRLQTHTGSGRHELFGSFGYVNARSTSGRLEIVSQIVPQSVIAQATSGRIELTVPAEEAISVQHSTGSGRFSSEIPIITHGGADAQFNLSTSSGRISIFALR